MLEWKMSSAAGVSVDVSNENKKKILGKFWK
jgi:hypothetical protein